MKEKDAIDVAAPAEGVELIDDIKVQGPSHSGSRSGNIVGYEYEVEEQPFWLQDIWYFQGPIRCGRAIIRCNFHPAGFLNPHGLRMRKLKPDEGSGNVLQWAVSDVKEIRHEPDMPPLHGVAGQMIVSFFPSGGTSLKNEFASWEGMGSWYGTLVSATDGRIRTDQTRGKRLSCGKGRDPGEDASHRRVRAARNSLRSNRTGYRRMATPRRSRCFLAPIRRLQGQSHPDAHHAPRDWRDSYHVVVNSRARRR